MSELLSQAAAALGLPEPLVRRSAEARATATGADVEEILAAWAGGEAPAPSAPPAEAEVEEAPTAEPEPIEPEEEEPEQPVPTPAAQPEVVTEVPRPAPVPAGAHPAPATRPPVLVGARDNPMTVLLGTIGLFLGVALLGLVGPAVPTDPPGARTSQLPYSESALQGREIYIDLGCSFCHTQMVRPVVADVGLGAVTLNDTNQVLGVRRFGPDLSDVGSRLTATQIEATVAGFGGHPPHLLAPEDMAALVAYLAESRTSPVEEESAEEEAPTEEGEGSSEPSGEEPEG